MTRRPLYALRLAQHSIAPPGMSFAHAVRMTSVWDMKHLGYPLAAHWARKLRLMTWG